MTTYAAFAQRRRFQRFVLGLAGPILATGLLALGLGLLVDPSAAERFARVGVGPELRTLLGVCHVAGGLALLAPALAEPVAILMAFVVAGLASVLWAESSASVLLGPALASVVLLFYGVFRGIRQRASVRSWQRLWQRYGEQAERGGV